AEGVVEARGEAEVVVKTGLVLERLHAEDKGALDGERDPLTRLGTDAAEVERGRRSGRRENRLLDAADAGGVLRHAVCGIAEEGAYDHEGVVAEGGAADSEQEAVGEEALAVAARLVRDGVGGAAGEDEQAAPVLHPLEAADLATRRRPAL